MRLAFVVVVMSCLFDGLAWPPRTFAQGLDGCGEEKHEIIKHKEHPSPTPPLGKAEIVLLFGSHFGKGYQHKLALGQRIVAVVNKSQYSFFEVDPGRLELSWNVGPGLPRVGSGTPEALLAQPNHVYYFRGTLTSFSQVDEAEGKRLIGKLDYVTFGLKGSKTEEEWTQEAIKFQEGWRQLRPGMTPKQVSDLLSLTAPLLLYNVPFSGRNQTSVVGKNASVTVTGNAGKVIQCGHVFDFDRNLLLSWR